MGLTRNYFRPSVAQFVGRRVSRASSLFVHSCLEIPLWKLLLSLTEITSNRSTRVNDFGGIFIPQPPDPHRLLMRMTIHW